MSAPNGELLLWDTADPARPERTDRLRLGRGIVAATWNPVATEMLATASVDGTGALWRLRDDRAPVGIARWPALPDRPQHVGWAAGGSWVFSMTGNGRTSVWDIDSGVRVGQADLSGGRPVVSAHYRGDEIVAITDTGWARLWNPRQRPGDWVRLTDRTVNACAWSSTALVVAGTDGQAACFDAEFQQVDSLRVAPDGPHALACSEDGHLVAAFRDNRVVAIGPDGSVRWQVTLEVPVARSIAIAGDLIAVNGGQPRPVLLTLATGAGQRRTL